VKVSFTPEYSAQRRSHPKNPIIPIAFSFLERFLGSRNFGNVCDLGCGKLRHLSELNKRATALTLVDTEFQLSRPQREGDNVGTIRDFVLELKKRGKKQITLLNSEEFSKSALNLDVIFLVNVTDVVPARTHLSIIRSAAQNLKSGGMIVIIFPRNDSSIMKRFTTTNKFQDGHYFTHGKVTTFIRNITNLEPLKRQLKSTGLTPLHEHIRFRQVMIVMQKRKQFRNDTE
jgi:SAM-dependent methyltransferase